MKVSIVIPNWNGKKLLEKNLPAVFEAIRNTQDATCEIVVVDDASPDDSDDFLTANYPQIKIVKHQKNLGFAAACNSGVKAAQGEVVILLNLDVIPEKNFLQYTLSHFKDPGVFAVSFNEPNWSWAKIFWKHGFIEHEPGPKSEQVHISAWASGGSAAFRKSMWEKLGGFDEIYKPFYWEDIDLGYRAWKKGYKILWEPKAIVRHEHEAVIGKHFTKEYVQAIAECNRLLFIWKNITDWQILLEHKINLAKKLIVAPGYWKPFLMAIAKIPAVFKYRLKGFSQQKISDKEIFTQF